MEPIDVPGAKQGDVYIFAVQGRVPNLYRVGSTTDFARRMRQHGSSHADSIEMRATRIRVCDVRRVEQCVNLWLRDKKYNGGKEVYQADYETIKSTIFACGLIAASHVKVPGDARALAPHVVGDESARPIQSCQTEIEPRHFSLAGAPSLRVSPTIFYSQANVDNSCHVFNRL